MAQSNPYQLLTENDLARPETAQAITTFWQQRVQEGEFKGEAGVPIRYAKLVTPENQRALVIVSGRVESYLKYKELAFDLAKQGYNLYLIDHRGQGRSGRLLDDPERGYVDDFDNYVLDLRRFITQVVDADKPAKRYLLAHSMGGAISARYLERWPQEFNAAVLSSPMMAIPLGSTPPSVAKVVMGVADTLGDWVNFYPYGPDQEPYINRPFENNELTHSPLRYQRFREQYEATPEIKLGGATVGWINEALKGSALAVAEADKIQTPVLVLQAGRDSVVDNRGQDEFCRRAQCAEGKVIRIEGAWHELFIESDQYRQPALTAALDFFHKQ